ncbi:MAG: DeoR/GlpR family DNA-binding transcription regulator [Clostridiaceae bacterium]
MFSQERKQSILNKLELEGTVLVSKLSKEFEVSEVTIRRDIKELEEKSLLTRTFGGAVPIEFKKFEPSFNEKKDKYLDEKIKIGKVAASLIKDDDTILLDSGTTTLEIARNLTAKNLTVITNSLDISLLLSNKNNINLIIIGGSYRLPTRSIVGALTLDIINKFIVDKAFIGVNCVSIKNGLTTPDINEALTKKAMINIANNVIIVADHSKFNKITLSKICGFADIDFIITDNNIDKEILDSYKNLNLNIKISE